MSARWRLVIAIGLVLSCSTLATELEIIEVTAQYKKQALQDVPISATVFNRNLIERLHLENSTQIANFSAGVSYSEFAPGQALLAMRGIVSADDGAAIDSSVVVFVDGIYLGRLANLNLALLDIERIEVLRGPQGTLFGRNAIGGAINIISKKPEFSKNAQLSITQGSYNLATTDFSAGTNVSNNTAFRLAFQQNSRDGYGYNVLRNEQTQNDNSFAGRFSLATELEHSRWLLSVDHSEEDKNDMGRVPIANGNYDYLALLKTLGVGAYQNASPINGFSKRHSSGLAFNYERFFDSSQLTVIAAWRASLADWEMASIGAPLNGQFNLEQGRYGAEVNDDIWDDTEQHSLELRWQTQLSESLGLTTGLFYLSENTNRTEQYKLDTATASSGQITLGNEVSKQVNKTDSYAWYASVDWQLTDKFQLLVGGRFSIDEKDVGFTSLNCNDQQIEFVALSEECASKRGSLGIIGTSFMTEQSKSWTDFSPRLVLQFHLNKNEMAYLSASKGYKAGGYAGSPGVISAAQTSLNPEQAYSYEIGYKSVLNDNTLSLATSMFYTDYRDLQVTWFGPSLENPNFGSFISTNVDKATIVGWELAADWQVFSQANIALQYGYLNTEVDEFVINTLQGQRDLSGSSLRQAPRHKYALLGKYTLYEGAAGDEYQLDIGIYGQSQQLADYINQVHQLPAYTLVNTGLKWINPNANLTIKAWYSNVSDKSYITNLYTTGAGAIGLYGAPRQFGLTVTWLYQ